MYNDILIFKNLRLFNDVVIPKYEKCACSKYQKTYNCPKRTLGINEHCFWETYLFKKIQQTKK